MVDVKLEFRQFPNTLQKSFHILQIRGELCDVTLVPGDGGQPLLAHRTVLAASSPTLLQLFLLHPSPHPMLFLRGVTSSSITLLMELLYTGQVVVAREQVEGLVMLATDLGVTGVAGVEEEQVQSNLEASVPQEEVNLETMKGVPNQPMEIQGGQTQIEVKQTDTFSIANSINGESINDKSNFIQRTDTTEPPENLICNLCGVKQLTNEKLKHHKNQHKKYTFPCPECKRGFKYESSRDTHIQIVHGGQHNTWQ